jgi:hypothetical protein
MAKVTDTNTSKALKKQSGSQADEFVLFKKLQRRASPTGLVQMVFDVTPETKNKLEEIARASGISLSQTAGILLEARITMHKKLEEEIRRKVSEAMDAEYSRLEEALARMNAPTETLNNLLVKLFPLVKSKMKKGVTN